MLIQLIKNKPVAVKCIDLIRVVSVPTKLCTLFLPFLFC